MIESVIPNFNKNLGVKIKFPYRYSPIRTYPIVGFIKFTDDPSYAYDAIIPYQGEFVPLTEAIHDIQNLDDIMVEYSIGLYAFTAGDFPGWEDYDVEDMEDE